MNNEPEVVEGIERHLSMYLDAMRQLTALLDTENQLLLFESGEGRVLGDEPAQANKQALYVRVETLARIVTRTMQSGSEEDIAIIQQAQVPIETFRRSLRLNSVLLGVCIERQERRMRRIMRSIDATDIASDAKKTEGTHVADHRA